MSEESMTNTNGGSSSTEPIGHPVSSVKFWVMCIFTLGFYILVWAYKNFRALKDPVKGKAGAVVYSLFLPVSLFSMMKSLEQTAASRGIEMQLPKLPLAISFFGIRLAERLVDKFDTTGLITLVLSIFAVGVLSAIQRKTVAVNQQLSPDAKIDSRFSAWDFVFIGVVIIGVIVAGIGMAISNQ